MTENLLLVAALGGATGLIYGAVSYFKNIKETEVVQKFNVFSFSTTVVGSGLVGMLAAYSGVTPDVISSSMTGVLITQFVKKLFAIILNTNAS